MSRRPPVAQGSITSAERRRSLAFLEVTKAARELTAAVHKAQVLGLRLTIQVEDRPASEGLTKEVVVYLDPSQRNDHETETVVPFPNQAKA